jgi:hypothetical protein
MGLAYDQVAQARENSTNAVSVFSSGAGETHQIRLKAVNVSGASATLSIFHDNDGTTYDESTALVWQMTLSDGQPPYEMEGIYMSNENGNLAYQSSVANAITMTVYSIEKT